MSLKERFVAVCDVLGFCEMVKKVEIDEIVSRYKNLINNVNTLRMHVGDVLVKPSHTSVIIEICNGPIFINYAIFSDTILFWTEYNEIKEIQYFFETIRDVVALSIKHKMPLRVGIAYGECFIDKEKNLFLGKPIVDAYLVEQSQEWIGGSCHESCNQYFCFHAITEDELILQKYDVPLKNDIKTVITGHAINWVPRIRNDNRIPKWLATSLEVNNQANIFKKYENTIKFYGFVTGNKEGSRDNG